MKCKICNNTMLSFLMLKEFELMYCDTCFSINKLIGQQVIGTSGSSPVNYLDIKRPTQEPLHVLNVYECKKPTLKITINGNDPDNFDVFKYNENWYENVRKQKFDVIVIDKVFDYLEEFGKMFEYIENISYDNSQIYINVTHSNIINKVGDVFFSNCKNVWTTNTMKQLCAKHGFTTNNAHIFIDSDYCTYEICKMTNITSEENNIFTLMIDELDRELYSTDTYNTFQYRYLMYVNTFMNFILYCKMNNSHIIGYGRDEQFKHFASIYSNYVQYFDYFISDENKYDILEQIRHGDVQSNAVVISFGESCYRELELNLIEFYSKLNFINLFDIEKLTTIQH